MVEGETRWVNFLSLSRLQENGDVVWTGSLVDVTEAKNNEVIKSNLELQLHQAQKMDSIGRLAGGVAHDFNNMLTVIIGHAELGLSRLEPASKVCDNLKEIRKTAERSADLTRQLLAFARKQVITPEVLDLNGAVSGTLKMLQRLIGEGVNLTWRPAPFLWEIEIDPSQIDQILANLCVNARDAIDTTGTITIETGVSAFDRDYCAQNPGHLPGEYVRLAVSDDGCGMDKETQEQIFEPFFTTKVFGEGTGLGLATVYGIVRQNKGFLSVASELGKGTTFTIHLPRYAGKDVRAKAVVEPAKRGLETILLVEDEQNILEITSVMLELQGYTVLAANTPDEAIYLAGEHSDKIHLLVTDVVMPGMNGRELATKLQSLYPHIKCLFMSGYTADVIARHGVVDSGSHFIAKPYNVRSLTLNCCERIPLPRRSQEGVKRTVLKNSSKIAPNLSLRT